MSPDAPKPTPPAPRPSPASLAPVASAVPTVVAAPASDAASFGRVTDEGVVMVRTPDGEREVGTYPDATPDEAIAFFARKYDELAGSARLLLQRVTQTDLSTSSGQQQLAALRSQVADAHVVGDLAALDGVVEQIATALAVKGQVEGEARAAAKAQAAEDREKLVAEAEALANTAPERMQWKSATSRMRELLDEWKTAQRSGARLDKDVESALWTRFSHARNGFDKTRRTFFAKLDQEHGSAKAAKTKLVAEAQQLSTSTDWNATAGAFKRLMGEWKKAGRASRSEDDALWAQFKAAQDAFFNAKDAVVAAENEEFEANLKVKEDLLAKAQKVVPADGKVTDVDAAKAALRPIQDAWDAAGKVPRKDMDRIERGMRRIEQAVRDAEQNKWKRTDPEITARARSMVEQLEKGLADVQKQLDKAVAAGNEKKVKELQDALEARSAWLEQVRASAGDLDA